MTDRCTRWLTLFILVVLLVSACSREKSAAAYLEDGRKNLESGDPLKAVAALEEALKREPGLAEANQLLGAALGQLDRWPEAVKPLEAYQALAPDQAQAYFALGEAYVQTGQLEKAVQIFAQGIQISPAYLSDHRAEMERITASILQAGQKALQAGDLPTASHLLDSVAPLVSGQGDIYLALGQAQLQAGDLGSALTAYGHAVGQNPELATEWSVEIDDLIQQGLERGQTALDAGDLSTATRLLQAVVALAPDLAQAHFVLGNAYNQADQLVQAKEQYETVLNLEPDSASALTNLGVVYYKAGDLDAAIQQFQQALHIESDDAETHYLLGAAYVQKEQLEQGKAEFKAALALDDQLAPPYIGLGNIYLLQADYDAALEALQQAITLAPNSPEAYFALAQVYIQLDDTDHARAALERVLSLNPAPYWRQQAETLLQSLTSD